MTNQSAGLPFAPLTAVSAALLPLCVGCGGERTGSASVVFRDSAGVSIVENRAPAWTSGEEWHLSEEPVLVIGVAEGPEEYQLFRANHALRLRNGEILIVNGGTNELRFYDSTGVFLRTVGREGAGPGEYKMMGGVTRFLADSLLVADFGNDRMVVLGPRGEFSRTFKTQPAPGAGRGFVDGAFADGTLLGRGFVIEGSGDIREGLTQSTMQYCRYDATGSVIDTLARGLGFESFGATVDGRPMSTSPPFARRGVTAVGPDRWYFGSTEAFEIEVHSPEGELLTLIRRATPNRPITAEITDDYRRRVLEGSSRLPESLRRWRANMPLPETMPAYRGFLVDDDRNLWVQEYRLPDEEPSWAVFDPDGRYLGNTDMPTDFGRPTHIGSDFVLGTWNDEMDVEYVRVYRLIKP